ncbi:Copia protein [Vitis vinifera]|uniref:Copia protein n=1 Tax=Vitis vinifera TaxID=29760 RepID=A0A438H3Y3_VITVI|nr:Copia protein [Vitis vinifera]
MRYLQGTKDYKLMYRWTSNLEVVGYLDSNFAGCVDSRKSTSGYIFILASGTISWRSVKQTMTATSIMVAEFISCFEVTSHGVWLKSFISRLKVMDSISRCGPSGRMLAEYTFTTSSSTSNVVQHFDHVLYHLSSAAVKEHVSATAQHGGKSNVV